MASIVAVGCGGSVRTGKQRDDGPTGGDGVDGGGATTGDAGSFIVDVLQERAVPKLDVLVMVDNSFGMADKQAVLAQSIPALVRRLTSPNCVSAADGMPDTANTPADPDAVCPASLVREFTPLKDIHIGVITSSLGGHGARSLCDGTGVAIEDEEQDDHGWLLASRPRFSVPSGGAAPDAAGFLGSPGLGGYLRRRRPNELRHVLGLRASKSGDRLS
ncbi:MAG TPA: hypothetical protein VH062_37185 [Polyangiaceae bacterium]|nr:hypothetical protein [Polyangiaceae bacterium]